MPFVNTAAGWGSYRGDSDPTEFFLRFEELAEAQGWVREHWSKVIIQLLDDAALLVYRALGETIRSDYDLLRSALTDAFASPPAVTLRVTEVRQGEDSVATFAWSLFRAVRADFPVDDTFPVSAQKKVLLKLFLSGLKPIIQFHLGVSGLPESFSAALSSAKNVEALLVSTRNVDSAAAVGQQEDPPSAHHHSQGRSSSRRHSKPGVSKISKGPCHFCWQGMHRWVKCYALRQFIHEQAGRTWSPQNVVARGLEVQQRHQGQKETNDFSQ